MTFPIKAATLASLLFCGTAIAQAPAAEPTEDEASAASAEQVEVVFDRDRYERMTVPVTIDGQGPYRFFVDTGAQATVVTPRIQEDLQIEATGRAMLVAMGSRRLVQTLPIDRLEFADRTLSGLTSPLLQRQHVGADGILGLDSLQDMRVLIDFAEGRMSVADAENAGDATGYEIVVRARAKLGQMIITDARLDGVKTAVIIDTGAQNSVGNMALLRRLRAKEHERFRATDVHGTVIEGDVAFAKRLQIGRMDLSNVPIGFADSPALEALGYKGKPALILGMGNLRNFQRIAIDFPTRRVLFDLPADALMRGPIDFTTSSSRIRS